MYRSISARIDGARAPGTSIGPLAELLHITNEGSADGRARYRLEVLPGQFVIFRIGRPRGEGESLFRAARRGHIGVLEVTVLYPAACRVLGSTKWESSAAG